MTKVLAILLACVFSAASLATPFAEHDVTPTSTAHDAHQSHDPSHGTTVAPPHGELWPTDEALRTGMSRIAAAVAQAASALPLSRERAVDLARTVEQNIKHIVEHCKLPPEPDAALHVLIGRMAVAANRLKEEGSADAAVAQLQSALHDYRATFDHHQ